MSKKKKIVPLFGIMFSVFIGLLVITMLLGLMFSCKSSDKDEKEEGVNYAYSVSALR